MLLLLQAMLSQQALLVFAEAMDLRVSQLAVSIASGMLE